jgi:putative pyruvate formate lyase activating enzyme
MSFCTICPRQCNADRSAGASGWCRLDNGLHVASICLHHGEEPPVSGEKGIVNVFFEHCNMQCIYCQNYEISCNSISPHDVSLKEACDTIGELLTHSEGNVGFVSPSHCITQMTGIVRELRSRGHNPIVVYNTNGYDSVDTIRSLEDIVDVWLPDFKYSDDNLAVHYSATPGYSAFALQALKEMVHQCGVTIQTNDRGIITRGVIVRHLVLPGATENSIGVLRLLAEEVSSNLHISLMSQYFPTGKVRDLKSLNRCITKPEYESVVEAFHSLGFHRGWLQDYESMDNYKPDFSRENPFSF